MCQPELCWRGARTHAHSENRSNMEYGNTYLKWKMVDNSCYHLSSMVPSRWIIATKRAVSTWLLSFWFFGPSAVLDWRQPELFAKHPLGAVNLLRSWTLRAYLKSLLAPACKLTSSGHPTLNPQYGCSTTLLLFCHVYSWISLILSTLPCLGSISQ